MNANIATEISRARTGRSARMLTILSLGPLAVTAGIAWALVQPYRVTLLHPQDQSLWWLLVEPPLLVIAAGVLFHLLVAKGLASDLEQAED